jgi:hypothetical protein
MIQNLWADCGITLVALSAFITFRDDWIPGGLISFSAGALSLFIGLIQYRLNHPHQGIKH